jgi:hypothetical protein
MTVPRLRSFDTAKDSHAAGVEISGFLGQPVLYRGTLHLDYRDNLVKFEYDEMKDPCLHPNLLHYRNATQMAQTIETQASISVCSSR